MRIAVAGAGIGGLTTALSLHRAGFTCRVYEAARAIKPLGVGINILPPAVGVLSELGLGDALAATGIPTAEQAYYDRFGNRIWGEARGHGAGERWPQYSIHRGELQMMLLDAVRERLGADAVRVGCAIERFEQSDRSIRMELRERDAGALTSVETDMLIGADGIHSTVRALLYPGEGPPHWNGVCLWRGVTEAAPFLTGRSMVVAGSNRTTKFVAYPISRRAEDRGRATINWVAAIRVGTGAALIPEEWNRKGRLAEVLPHFESWRFDWLDIPALISGAESIFEFPMLDRDPLPRWSCGRATLLGDAAHPMYPIGSNGASQAILDAQVLASELAHTKDPKSAIASYEAARRPLTNDLVVRYRGMGPDRVLALVEERAPNGFRRIEDVLSPAELQSIPAVYKTMRGEPT